MDGSVHCTVGFCWQAMKASSISTSLPLVTCGLPFATRQDNNIMTNDFSITTTTTSSSSIAKIDNNALKCNSTSKKQRRLILSEEEYTSTLQQIITRDYYPSIPSLQRDAAVLQKRSEGDTTGAIAIRRAARKIESNEARSRIQEEIEEEEAILHNGGVRKRPRPLDRESVDGFHARVTSEDNAYFEENMEREVKERRENMEIIYRTNRMITNSAAYGGHDQKLLKSCDTIGDGNGTNSNNILKDKDQYNSNCNDSPFITASDQFTAPVERIHAAGTTIDGESKSYRNSLFFTPQHYNPLTSPTIDSSSQQTNKSQPLQSNTSNDKPCNNDDSQIMPPPPSRQVDRKKITTKINNNNDIITTVNSDSNINCKSSPSPNESNLHLVEYQAKPRNRELISGSLIPSSSSFTSEKQIMPQNTRFEYQNQSRIVATSSHCSTMVTEISKHCSSDTNTATKLYETDSSMNTDLDAPLRPLYVERQARIDQLKKERNTLVAMTPTIIPGANMRKQQEVGDGSIDNDDDDENDSPIVTWGKIASTPLVADGEKLSQMYNVGMNSSSSINCKNDDMINDDGCEGITTNEKTFSLPCIDDREKAAKKVEEKLARQKQRFDEAGGHGGGNHQERTRNKAKAFLG